MEEQTVMGLEDHADTWICDINCLDVGEKKNIYIYMYIGQSHGWSGALSRSSSVRYVRLVDQSHIGFPGQWRYKTNVFTNLRTMTL